MTLQHKIWLFGQVGQAGILAQDDCKQAALRHQVGQEVLTSGCHLSAALQVSDIDPDSHTAFLNQSKAGFDFSQHVIHEFKAQNACPNVD